MRTLGQYVAALAVCLLVLGTVFDLGSDARKWPFAYRGDTMFYHLLAKNVIDEGWSLDVPLLGAPDALNLRDVPTSDNNLHVLLLWFLSLGTSHYPSLLNNFFLLGFLLVFLSALVVLRHFGVAWWTSICMSLLYTFAPFHIMRGEHHLFLSAYWQVPLAVLVALWVSGEGLWRSSRRWLAVVICLALSATGYYYAFFACFFLFIAGLVAAAREKSWRRLATAVGLGTLIAAGVIINLGPSLLHFQDQGGVPTVQRAAGDADFYGLRIAQLLLPVRGHRLQALEELKTEYTRRPLINENDDVSLGVVGALGFLGLLWWSFFRNRALNRLRQRGTARVMHHLSLFNLAALLFGTIGGFGSLVAFFGLPQVRAYNRIGVFLSFFAFFAVALWVDHVGRRYATTRARAIGLVCALAVATVVGLYDQISPKALPDYTRIKAHFAGDSAFVQQIEHSVPRGALIFQLPFTAFPENLSVRTMPDYDLLRGYLHSGHLRWSYGTIRGREGNAWLRHMATLPADRLVETLAWAGFSGIYINRNGVPDGGARIDKQLGAMRGVVPLHSPDGELVFYNLMAHRAWLEEVTPPAEWDAKREAALYPPLAVWRDGFTQEDTAEVAQRWGGSTARMLLLNRAARPQHVRLEMAVVANPGGSVTFSSPLFGTPVRVEPHRARVDRLLVLPPGRHEVLFESDAPRVYPPDDFRDLVFGVRDFKLTPVTPPLEESTPSPDEGRQSLSVRDWKYGAEGRN